MMELQHQREAYIKDAVLRLLHDKDVDVANANKKIFEDWLANEIHCHYKANDEEKKVPQQNWSKLRKFFKLHDEAEPRHLLNATAWENLQSKESLSKCGFFKRVRKGRGESTMTSSSQPKGSIDGSGYKRQKPEGEN